MTPLPAPPRRAPLPLLLGGLLAIGLGLTAWRFGRPAREAGPAPGPATLRSPAPGGFTPPPGEVPGRAVGPVSSGLAAELEAIQAEPDDARREKAWANLEARLAAAGLPSAVARCFHPGASEPELELGRRLLRHWVAEDADSAAGWALGRPAGPSRQQAIDTVATLWAGSDLSAAIGWAGRLSIPEERQSALLGIAYEAARTEPVSALALALELPETRLRDDLLAHAAAQCATLAPAAAVEVAREFPDALLRDRLLGAIATSWAETDPTAAAGLAMESIGTPRLRDDAVIGILQRWAQKDHAAASRWVDGFPAGPLRDTAVDTLRQLRPAAGVVR